MIRPAAKDDIPFIIRCLQAMRVETSYLECADDPEYVAYCLENMFDHDSFSAFIAEGNKGVALSITQPQWYDCRLRTFEQLLYVCPEHRKGTVAMRLIAAICADARERGAIEVQAGALTDHRESAVHALYRRMGFEDYKGGVRYRIT